MTYRQAATYIKALYRDLGNWQKVADALSKFSGKPINRGTCHAAVHRRAHSPALRDAVRSHAAVSRVDEEPLDRCPKCGSSEGFVANCRLLGWVAVQRTWAGPSGKTKRHPGFSPDPVAPRTAYIHPPKTGRCLTCQKKVDISSLKLLPSKF